MRYKKYFYGNTVIDNHNFDYHATGKQILIGRVIVLGALFILALIGQVSVELYFLLYLVLIACLGIIISRALRFNARVSSFRNVRFNFTGSAMEAFVIFVLIPIANVFTLGLLTPVFTRELQKYVTNNHLYGDRNFRFNAGLGGYYGYFFAMIGAYILGFILLGIVFGIFATSAKDMDFENLGTAQQYLFVILMYGVFFLIFFPASMIYRAGIRNIHFNNTELDDRHSFISTVEVLPLAWIVLSNAIVTLFSLGLMLPWARIRLARYMADNTQFVAGGPLDVYTSDVLETHGVTAAEYVDIEGFDIDLGI